MEITPTQFKKAAPMCPNAELWCDLLWVTPITNRSEFLEFLAQCAHETQGFTRLEENLNYSAERLVKVWKTRFTARTAAIYARRPAAIANYVYADRNGNGDEASGDGWMFRGSGPLMLTGRGNFRDVGYEHTPDAVRTPENGLHAALKWWTARDGLREAARQGRTDAVRRVVNGPAMLGLEDVRRWVGRFAEVVRA